MVTISIPRVALEELRKRAKRAGVSLEEYIVEISLEELDPSSKAEKYIKAALELLEEAKAELQEGNLRQASEKIWGAAALAIKAHAYVEEGRRLTSHGGLWDYKTKLAAKLGDWVRDSWNAAVAMHVNFYEGWAGREDVEDALKKVGKLVGEILRDISA